MYQRREVNKMRNIRGSDLSINVIIITAIALLVLAVLAYLLLGAADNAGEGTKCTGIGGQCQTECAGTEYPVHNAPFDSDCSGDQKCCVRFSNNEDQ